MTIVADYAWMDCPGDTTAKAGVDPHAAVAAGVGIVVLRGQVCYFDAKHDSWIIQRDPVAERDAQAWRDAGAVVMEYMFPGLGHGRPGMAQQVATFASTSKVLPGVDLPPGLDIEFPGRGIVDTHQTQAEVGDDVVESVNQLVLSFGLPPFIYTSHVQMHDTNGLGGVLAGSAELAACPLWDKVPYPVGAGKPPQLNLARPPHDGSVSWDRGDLWRYPSPWNAAWMLQEQGDVRGFAGLPQADIGVFVNLSPANPRDARWPAVAKKLGITGELTASSLAAGVQNFQSDHGLVADGIIGPRTFVQLAWL